MTPTLAGEPTNVVTELRVHARNLIVTVLELEVTQVLRELKSAGSVVVRTDCLTYRSVATAIGNVTVGSPLILARDGE
jgi:hypothetical protein